MFGRHLPDYAYLLTGSAFLTALGRHVELEILRYAGRINEQISHAEIGPAIEPEKMNVAYPNFGYANDLNRYSYFKR